MPGHGGIIPGGGAAQGGAPFWKTSLAWPRSHRESRGHVPELVAPAERRNGDGMIALRACAGGVFKLLGRSRFVADLSGSA